MGLLCGALKHNNLGAQRNAVVEVLGMIVEHADAAIGDGPADRGRFIGSMDPVHGVSAGSIEI